MQSDRCSAAKQECDISAKQSIIITILTLLNVGYVDEVRMSTICSEAAKMVHIITVLCLASAEHFCYVVGIA